MVSKPSRGGLGHKIFVVQGAWHSESPCGTAASGGGSFPAEQLWNCSQQAATAGVPELNHPLAKWSRAKIPNHSTPIKCQYQPVTSTASICDSNLVRQSKFPQVT